MHGAKPQSKPRGPGRPFTRGGDPRQWRGGRGTTPLTDALRGALLALAKGGNIQAIREVFDRVEGKAIARTEQGEPGEFEKPDLSEFSTEELRAAIRAVRG